MKKISSQLFQETSLKAKRDPRKRINYNFHEQLQDPLQHLLNAIEPDSYIRPHRHLAVEKTEIFILLRGRGAAFEFNDQGTITDHCFLNKEIPGVVFKPGVWHTLISLEEGTVFFEAKNGPYIPVGEGDVAPWAPAPEDKEAALSYLRSLRKFLSPS